MPTRREFLKVAAGVAIGGETLLALNPAPALSDGPARPPRLPARQHAWESTLGRDEHGNAVAPRYDRLLFFDLRRAPTLSDAHQFEQVLRTLERRYDWSPRGLLLTAGWGPRYFQHWLGVRPPIPHPERLSDFELPTLDAYDLCVHLACDNESRLATVESALVRGAALPGVDGPLDLSPSLRWRETRTGFTGTRLPAAHQDVSGIPAGRPVPAQAPLFMGFKSGYTRNQASEDDVTIPFGPLAGGTTMHVSRMRLRLDGWYGILSEKDRVARMYGPEVTPADVARFTTDAPSHPGRLEQDGRRYGLVGHAQTSARARRNGRAIILRRDFDTVDGGQAGLHFVSLQRSIADFVSTRKAMNASQAGYLNAGISDTVNNGINEFIFVTHRANYAVPPRQHRSYPLLRI